MTADIEASGRALTEADEQFLARPHPRLDHLRSTKALFWDGEQGHYLITRYDLAKRVMQDRTMLRDRRAADPGSAIAQTYEAPPPDIVERKNGAQVLIFKDDPDHSRLRSIIGATFLVRLAGAREAVAQIVRDQVSNLNPNTTIDVVADYAIPIPVRVICHLLGVEGSDAVNVRFWSDEMVLGFNPFRTESEDRRRWQAIREMLAFFKGLVAQRRASAREDLISDWVGAQEGGAGISDPEIVDHCIMMLTAGNLSTTDLIANTVLHLLQNPAERSRMLAEPERISAVIEESLRFDSPVTVTDRIAPCDVEIAGEPVCKGRVLSLSLPAANHDPAVFPNPHRFDTSRRATPHLAFGAGAHICLGAPLARLEGQLAVAALFARFPNLSLAEEVVVRRPVPGHRGVSRLLTRA